ncbi:MAG: methionine--tRNA ligase [Nitrospirales bacterium]|nr:methionine--tRNA ligase [Nitrospira sp.]MDR4502115.1 methionine--tRNA ligase [Nitrospirales bacterium]
MTQPFYITTPIYYVNDVPHIGHAYTTIAADVLARFRRLQGQEVFFLTGLDEHGQKVQQAAAKSNIDPKTHCDRLMPQFQDLWKKLSISHDGFIRTTDHQHQVVVQRFLQTLYDKDLIYKAEYTGWYCTYDERFWTEKDVEDGLCPDCKRPVEQLSESNYFFRMSRYQEALRTHIHQHEHFIRPLSRRNEVLGFLEKPLEDLSISRPKSRLSWGIELPFDDDYVTYVWFDALSNYISALEYLPANASIDRYWPATVHLVGKDILTTHAVYWSTMLMALGLPLPQTIFAHGWWTVEGEKMSKSRGNVVDPNLMVEQYGVDTFRYFLLREVPFGQDGDFSQDSLIGRANSDLANGLGNLLSRTVTLIQRFANGVIPEPATTEDHLDRELQAAAETLLATTLPSNLSPERIECNRALENIWALVQLGNQYIDKTAPWVLAKDSGQRERLNTVLYNAAEVLRFLCLANAAFMPATAQTMNEQLGLSLDFSQPLLSDTVSWGKLMVGAPVHKGPALFPRIERDQKQKEKTQVSEKSSGMTQPSPDETKAQADISTDDQISIEDFMKVQLKVAKILEAERVPKSNKLLKLQVDLGNERRQIVAGIGKTYEPEQLIGRTIVVVANLKPAKLMGVESQGMVLAAGDKEVLGLLTLKEEVAPGQKVK